MKPTAVSLFSGCGGSDAGLIQAGFDVIMANDILPYAKSFYELNFPETDYKLQDIRGISSFPKVDLLAGCYPCQGFSQGGARKADRKINYLYKEFNRALNYIEPKAFIVENVSGMLRSSYKHLLDDQLNLFGNAGKHGYKIKYALLNAADYGVAQKRKRIIIVGVKNNIDFDFNFPAPTHGTEENPYLTIKQALKGLPSWPKGKFCDQDFHWYYMSRNRRCDWEEASKTIVSNMRHMPLHPISPKMIKIGPDEWQFEEDKPARRFAYTEAAKLQGFDNSIFPDDLTTSLSKKYTVIGNAVPPALFKHIGLTLKPIFS